MGKSSLGNSLENKTILLVCYSHFIAVSYYFFVSKWPFWGFRYGSYTVLGPKHIADQLLFFYAPFNSDIKFLPSYGVVFAFWAPMGIGG